MPACIVIAPLDLLDSLNDFAIERGFLTNQLNEFYSEQHKFCQFTATQQYVDNLYPPLPEWLEIIDVDNESSYPWNVENVGIFLSSRQDGWVFKATVDNWMRS